MIKISDDLAAKSAGEVLTLLKKRYPKATKAELDSVKKRYYGKDKGAEKLNSGNAGSDKGES